MVKSYLSSIISAFVFVAAPAVVAEETVPFQWAHALTLESVSNFQGGIERGSRQMSNLDLTLAVDTGAANWWGDGTFFVYVLGNYGKAPSDITGDLQTISNIQAPNDLKINELWYQHSFADGAVKVLFGLHDYNSTFYSLESAGLFANSSFGIGPELAQVGPSIFPNTATTLHFTFTFGDQYLLIAAYDGIPGDPEHPHGTHVKFKNTDGLFKAAEWGIAHEKSYKFAVGGWQHTAQVESPIDGGLLDDNSGFYVIGEKNVTDNLAFFLQYGHANADKNQLDNYTGFGATLSNTWVDEDALGLGYSRAHNGSAYLEVNPDLLSAETILELTYQRPLMEHLKVQSSLYSIQHPSMDPSVEDALALGVRLYIEF